MNKNETALYIGRFQPFHNGHLDAIRQIFDAGKTRFLIIAIGNAQTSHTPENPFTAGERFEMIYESLLLAGFLPEQLCIVPIQNIDDYSLWPQHVVRMLPRFSRIYSGSRLVQRLFCEYLPSVEVIPLQMRIDISATAVRKNILEGNPISDLVPEKTAERLLKIHAKERMHDICQTNF
jgi:nicotinamide-nucleotide adenylyltransferase